MPQVRAPVLGVDPSASLWISAAARTPAVGLNLGAGKSEALFRAPSVPDLALSTPI